MRRARARPIALLAVLVSAAAAVTSCGIAGSATPSAGSIAVEATATPTSATPTTTPPTSSSTTTTTTTTTTSTTTSTTSTTSTTVAPTLPAGVVPPMDATVATFDALAAGNAAVSMTVLRDGQPILRRASGTAIDGKPATPSSPMVVASVSKVLTAMALARLEQAGAIRLGEPVPWRLLGINPHPAWNDVTVRELLDHTSGMPVARPSWFLGGDICWTYLPMLVSEAPHAHRGEWTYSNGNYCALGLLVGALTGLPLDAAIQQLVLDPAGADGVHLSTDGERPTDVRYPLGLPRLARLGGAGTLIVSTDAIAAALASATSDDRRALSWPAMMTDQYGWGHTGTVDGAKSCAWVLEDGRTVAVVTVSGNRPSTGGGVCDLVVPAVAADLGLPVSGEPERTPR